MNNTDSLLWVADTHAHAESAIRALHAAGVDVTKLSLIGKGYQLEEHPIGFYNVGARMKAWGGAGMFWGGLWGLLLAPAVFVLPGVGVVALAGPVVSALFGALEGAVSIGAVAAIAAALASIGVPKDQIINFSRALHAEQYVLVMHGDAGEVARARAALSTASRAHPTTLRNGLPSRQSAGIAATVV